MFSLPILVFPQEHWMANKGVQGRMVHNSVQQTNRTMGNGPLKVLAGMVQRWSSDNHLPIAICCILHDKKCLSIVRW